MLITLGKIMTNRVQTLYANKAILALAPDLQTGFAFCPTPGAIISGSWDLSPQRGEVGLRYQRFGAELDRLGQFSPLDVLYEQVHPRTGTQARRVHRELLGRLKAWCLERGITPQPVGVGEIKKFWTGRGNATKDEMVVEARLRGFDPVDANEANALALLHYRIVEGPDNEALAGYAATRPQAAQEARRYSE
jgi:hypothetical protein